MLTALYLHWQPRYISPHLHHLSLLIRIYTPFHISHYYFFLPGIYFGTLYYISIVIPVCTAILPAGLPSSNRFSCLHSRSTPRTILLRTTTVDLPADLPSPNRFSCLNSRSTHRTIPLRTTLRCPHTSSSLLFVQPFYPPIYPRPIVFPVWTADLPHVQSSSNLPSDILIHHRHSCLHSRYTRRINTRSTRRSINDPTRLIGIITLLLCYSHRDAVPTPRVHL